MGMPGARQGGQDAPADRVLGALSEWRGISPPCTRWGPGAADINVPFRAQCVQAEMETGPRSISTKQAGNYFSQRGLNFIIMAHYKKSGLSLCKDFLSLMSFVQPLLLSSHCSRPGQWLGTELLTASLPLLPAPPAPLGQRS